MHRLPLLSFLGLALPISAVAAEWPAKHSARFEYCYEGNAPLYFGRNRVNVGAGYSFHRPPPKEARISSKDGWATFYSPRAGGLQLRNPLWESDADDAEGWTWEIRLRTPTSASNFSCQVRLGEWQHDRHHPHLGLQFGAERIVDFHGLELARGDFSNEAVTVRVAQLPHSDEFHVWINNQAVELPADIELLVDDEPPWLGDGSSQVGVDVLIDYVRWTGLGGFAPATTPATDAIDEDDLRMPPLDVASQSNDVYRSRPRELPDFGLMLNDDGDVSFPSSDPELAKRYRQLMIDALAGTPVKTLVYSVGMGSDVLYYPTEAASRIGWRRTKYDAVHENPAGDDQMWAQRIVNIRNGVEAGVDPIRVSGERAKSLDMFFVPSYRMNDDHFMFDPLEYPMTGEFWLQHHEQLKIRHSPIVSEPRYGQLFDYSHPEVRQFRLQVIAEIIERYQDLMDGLELDFNRVQVFFPYQKAEQRAWLMTQLVAEVRKQLDEVGQRNGRSYYLLVRVPPTLKNCRWAGLQVDKWLERSLVDVVIPSQLMTLSHDMPIAEFVELADPVGAQVYPAIYQQTNFTGPIQSGDQVSHAPASRGWIATDELLRGAASNYWQQGAAGFQLYNFRTIEVPFTDRMYRVMRDLADPASLSLANKTFAITPAYYLDYEDTYQDRKQLPCDLAVGKPCRLRLYVGEGYGEAPLPDAVMLRLGMRALPKTFSLQIALNDQTIFAGAADDLVESTPDSPASAADSYWQAPVENLKLLKVGENQLVIQLDAAASEPPQLVECHLGVHYAPRPNAIFEP